MLTSDKLLVIAVSGHDAGDVLACLSVWWYAMIRINGSRSCIVGCYREFKVIVVA